MAAKAEQFVASAVPKRSHLHLVQPGEAPTTTYADIAKQAGFDSAEIIRDELLEFLACNDMKVYDRQGVDKWLCDRADEMRVTEWGFVALRSQDRLGFTWVNGAEKDGYRAEWTIRGPSPLTYEVRYAHKTYRRVVPQHALEKVLKIEHGGLEGRVSFYVSEFLKSQNPKPDPFLLVRPSLPFPDHHNGLPHAFVIDVWDEPGFGL